MYFPSLTFLLSSLLAIAVLPALSVADPKLDAAKQLSLSKDKIQEIKDHARELVLTHKFARAVAGKKLKELHGSQHYLGSIESSADIKRAISSFHHQHRQLDGIHKATRALSSFHHQHRELDGIYKSKKTKDSKSSKKGTKLSKVDSGKKDSGKKSKKSDTCSGVETNCTMDCEDFFPMFGVTAPCSLCESACDNCSAECGDYEDESNEDCFDACLCPFISQYGFDDIYEGFCLGNDNNDFICQTPAYAELCEASFENEINFLDFFNESLPDTICGADYCGCSLDCDDIPVGNNNNTDEQDACFVGCICEEIDPNVNPTADSRLCGGDFEEAICQSSDYIESCINGTDLFFDLVFSETRPDTVCGKDFCGCQLDCDDVPFNNTDDQDACFQGCICDAVTENENPMAFAAACQGDFDDVFDDVVCQSPIYVESCQMGIGSFFDFYNETRPVNFCDEICGCTLDCDSDADPDCSMGCICDGINPVDNPITFAGFMCE